jgi:peptidoglycan/LPS O-acetylase OafA/YrhL
MDRPSSPRASWIPCADGLRATAATAVFLHHASFLTGVTFNSRAGAFFARFDIGVPVFFALSGFLLSRPYIDAILDDRSLPDWRGFYRRRVVRIIPAYWLALTATYLWLRPDSATRATGIDYPLHYLFLQIYPADSFPRGISPAWTLAVEASFYAALPLLAVFAHRRLRTVLTPSRRSLLLLGWLTAALLASLTYRTVLHARGGPMQAVLWLPGMFGEFAVGIAIAVLASWAHRREFARPLTDFLGRHDLLWWTFAALLLVFQSTQLGLERGLDHANWNRELYSEIVRILIATFLLLPVAFGPQDRGIVRRLLRSWPIASLGVVSYGVFLWHVPLIEAVINWTGRHPFLDWSQPGMSVFSGDVLVPVAIAFACSVLAGTVSWFAVERPLLRRAGGRRRATPSPEPTAQAAP